MFVNVSWKWAKSESQEHFLTRLGTGSLLGTFLGGEGTSKILDNEGLPPSPSREKPVVPQKKSVKNFKPPIWLHPTGVGENLKSPKAW